MGNTTRRCGLRGQRISYLVGTSTPRESCQSENVHTTKGPAARAGPFYHATAPDIAGILCHGGRFASGVPSLPQPNPSTPDATLTAP